MWRSSSCVMLLLVASGCAQLGPSRGRPDRVRGEREAAVPRPASVSRAERESRISSPAAPSPESVQASFVSRTQASQAQADAQTDPPADPPADPQADAQAEPLPGGRPPLVSPPPQEGEIGDRFLPPPAIPGQPHPLSPFGRQVSNLSNTPLTLETLEALACQNNPTLLQAQAQVEGTLGRAIQAGLWPNPTLIYSGEQLGVKGTAGEFHGGIVRQQIVTAHKLDLSREKFLARTRVAEWLALAQQYRVLNDVRLHYFRSRGRQELLQIQRELLKNAEDRVVTVREMYNVGQANRAEVHQANVLLQEQRLAVLMAENEYRTAFEELTAMVGLDLRPAPLDTPLEGDFAPIEWDAALSRLISESPQMMAAQSKLEADRVTIRRELAEPVPDLIVQGGTGYNFAEKETVGVASLSLEVPLFDWNQGTIRQAEADYARQQGEVRRTELVLRRDLARQYRTYLTALQHARNYREVILPEARQAYEILLQSYKQDRAPWDTVLAAEQQYFASRNNYVQNLIAWRESEVLIMGYLLHSGLEAPSNPAPPGHINAVPKPR